MSYTNPEYQTPRQILLLQQMMFVVKDMVASMDELVFPRHFMASFAYDPTKLALRSNFNNASGFLDISHQLARECAQNCFLIIDIAKYDEEFRRNVAVLVKEFRDSLPEKMKIDKATLSEFLERTGFEGVTGNFDEGYKDSLEARVNDSTQLYLVLGKKSVTIETDQANVLLERMLGGLSGFGQFADHFAREVQWILGKFFGVSSGDAGQSFVKDLEAILRACPIESRDLLAEQIGMGAKMEERLQKVMEQNPQQLYFAAEFSEESKGKMIKLCEMVGVAMPQSFEPPIKTPMTAVLAACELMARYEANCQYKLYLPDKTVPEFLKNAINSLEETGNPKLQTDPIFQALAEYHKKSKTPDGVTGSGAEKTGLPSTRPNGGCPFGKGGGYE